MRFIDGQADWIRRVFTPKQQTRLGVVMTDLGILYFLALPVSGEPPLIFTMSAFALVFGGIGVVVTAVLAETNE